MFVVVSYDIVILMDVRDKVVVIIGSTGGIGSEIAKAFSEEGAKLILVGRNEEKLKQLKEDLGSGDNEMIGFDSTRTAELDYLTKRISEMTKVVDVLINAAGVGVYKNLEDVSLKEWEDSFSINVTTPYFLTKELLPFLKQSGESYVINIGSGMGKIPTPCRSVYCATKYALRGMSLSLAAEFYKSSINIIHVALGSTLTEFGPLSIEEKKEENLKGKSYFTPIWVAKRIVSIVKNGEKEVEINLYPSDYQ